ncbi:Uncharacterized protein Adt_00097 [Abeliophyllum distichum]|uniref:Uncharacterized protein n=1 Tax=Abeliophyllum distichum TaxID=126358 RepID=A0ABD1VP49_9LAMI
MGRSNGPPVDREPIRPPGWNVARRGRRPKKRRLQLEEVVVKQKGGSSKMKRVGTVTMTCSLCGLTGHNKRYHDKSNVSHEEFFGQEMDQSVQDCGSQNITKTSQSRAKLQPRRCQKSGSSQPNEPQVSDMRFMPTPGIIGPAGAVHGPDVAVHGPDLQPNVSFDNMVEDLQLMEREEQSRMKAQRAKNKRNLRDSIRFRTQQNSKDD